MPTTETLDSAMFANQRTIGPHPESVWTRPARVRSTSYDQPVSPALADMTFRDASWLTGDRRDLYALAAMSVGFAAVAAALAMFTA